ncbi:energy transducer TonB [Pseudoalteromonas luteoviolacea]|uniref:TonB C-terminal domain-containing protein n=1 Tax=Pseudoalteromonas luteoviolacea S4054 TaxID=1129367 RepID=A0A0F6AIA1_9GAMM|nr:energy transducer TonB [Pseudoalteromonas luteoviolacea]AOT07859.1 hypothetical protein S4054249_08405 [Pseudoalteromonas luteoviolacea]AOT12775.1 hypothetical protein S40542_08405 [Pseudoalteromonas luteoviolacea]AOT17688.1 hypothetical protein S4054_08400 [Pseudoalteromonas luteoviolacea]KKE85903.1 hypothetical protein N479_00585 [Pseudoalteromonas luteoviolacea S4054]KZN74781.1 hypothetical protein N481_08965 [Pseudoalteromonas luteoviolacea S4047-1]
MNLMSALLLAASTLPYAAKAAQTDEDLIGKVIDAVPIEKSAAVFPRLAADRGREGWVQLSYVINEKGEVESPVIEHSSGHASFERSALKAVNQWKFKPALQNGKPVKQCKNQVQMSFYLQDAPRSVSSSFLNRYKKIGKKIDSNDLESIPELFGEMRERKLKNFTEDTYYWVAKARYYAATGDKYRELHAIIRVIKARKGYIPDDMFIAFLSRATVLNLEHNLLFYALHTFERLAEFPDAQASINKLKPFIDKARALIKDDSKTIWVKGKIKRSLWSHKLVRNAFTIADINGSLSSLEVRCKNQFSSYDVKPGLKWNIPKNWQGCQVYVYGDKGASFHLVETPHGEEV